MSHPIVIIVHESNDAIKAAVEALKTAGETVKLLETPKSKLVDFLGALAGVDDESEDEDSGSKEKTAQPETDEENPDADATDDVAKPAVTTDDNAKPASATDSDVIEPKMEGVVAIVEGVMVDVHIGQPGCKTVLHPTMRSASSGAVSKVSFQVNESVFSSWVESDKISSMTQMVELVKDGSTMKVSALLGSTRQHAAIVIDPGLVASIG
jgi:hypothetical protein